jgi:hypothetical protein
MQIRIDALLFMLMSVDVRSTRKNHAIEKSFDRPASRGRVSILGGMKSFGRPQGEAGTHDTKNSLASQTGT